MGEATIALAVMTFLILLVFLGFFIWGIRTGQFKNVEEAKHLPLEDDQPPGDRRPAAADGAAERTPSKDAASQDGRRKR